MSAGASPQAHWGSSQRFSRPPSWFQGPASRQEGNGGEGKGGLWEGEEGKGGEWGMGK